MNDFNQHVLMANLRASCVVHGDCMLILQILKQIDMPEESKKTIEKSIREQHDLMMSTIKDLFAMDKKLNNGNGATEINEDQELASKFTDKGPGPNSEPKTRRRTSKKTEQKTEGSGNEDK